MIKYPLMPKATALWFIKHTCLTWEQIGDFCGLHALEIDQLNEDPFLQEKDPILAHQIDKDDLEACQKDPKKRLTLLCSETTLISKKKYIPLSKRREVPNGILWLLRYYPKLSDGMITKLLPTTKVTVQAIRNGTYSNMQNLVAKDPVFTGLCSDELFQKIIGTFSKDAGDREKDSED